LPDSAAVPGPIDRLFLRRRPRTPATQTVPGSPFWMPDEQDDYGDQTKHPTIACLGRFSAAGT
jgi:hypothetical protein